MSVWRWITSLFGVDGDAPAAEAPSPTAAPSPAAAPAPEPPPALPAPRWPAALADVREHPGGGIASARVLEDVSIQGIPCAAGTYVGFHRNGALASAVLARSTTCDGEALAKGAQVGFDPAGGLDSWSATLEAPREVRVRSKDAATIGHALVVPAGSTCLFEHRQLRTLTPAAPLELDGVTFPEGCELTFGDSGALSHARADVTLEVRGIPFAPHEEVVFLFGRLHEGWLDRDHEVDGIPCLGHEIVRFDERGRLARAFLSRDVVISGIPCLGGTRVYLDEEGRLLEGKVAEDTSIAGVPVAAESVVALHEGLPVLVTVREDVTLRGVPLLGGTSVELSAEGRPLAYTLAEEHTLGALIAPRGSRVVEHLEGGPALVVMTDGREDGAPRAGTWSFFLAQDGAIRLCLPTDVHTRLDRVQLREDAVLEGLPALRRMPIELEAARTPRSLVLSRAHEVRGLRAKAQTRVTFHPGGPVAELALDEDATIDGVPCRRATRQGMILNELEHRYDETVRLHPNGRLAFATLSRDAEVRGVPLASGHTVVLRDDGSLHVGTSARDHLVGGLTARAGSLIALFPDGSPSTITLAAAATLGGIEHAADATLTFSAPGELDHAEAARALEIEALPPEG